MSTLSQHRRALGRLHANTVPTPTKGASAAGLGAAKKGDTKKKFRGVLKSIVTEGKKNEQRAESGPAEDVSLLESPTKKTKVDVVEDTKPAASAMAMGASGMQDQTDPDIFRKIAHLEHDLGFWSNEMEELLEIKRATPISEDADNIMEDGNYYQETEGVTDELDPLADDLNENVAGEPIMWSSRVVEDGDGLKIHIDT